LCKTKITNKIARPMTAWERVVGTYILTDTGLITAK
jgi:hypothetical protein